ncbi:MAG: DEAD/DEAH box helicase family protein [Crocinitomicaceae bacterium]|nr:DEAD/DEAH box helicase family protein [Flavobacteriales bacterium]NQZ34076.1 DEAD/DEAH box helicase family protein [Crocinitomicaceae bacterium]
MTNFHFLTEWPEISQECTNAESHIYSQPRFSAILCRSALEKIVHWIYEYDSVLELPYDTKLSSLIHGYEFKENIGERLFREINLVRKIGNPAAHGGKTSANSALIAVKALHSFAAYLLKYYGEQKFQIETFDESLLKTGEEEKLLKRQLELLQEKLEKQESDFRKEQHSLQEKVKFSEEEKAKLLESKRKTTERREERQKTLELNKAIPHNIPESVTRKVYIDLLLQEAGWSELREGRELEYEVIGMPKNLNPSGIGYVDYVLWGKDGLPLAVVEAKKAMISAEKGRHQAVLYADCLEQMHGQRPVIFYTNGFETHLWDDRFWTPREVQGFYTKDEIQLMINRRVTRKDLRQFQIDPNIAGRPYQIEAIQRVAERFVGDVSGQLKGRHRRGLLVMATGSGKTRTAASIIDMLTKCHWAKRVLFLADRNALVRQAKNAISTQLPNLSCIDLTKEKEDSGTRMVFSTYPTMMNKIDSVKTDDERFYGVGHFDVIFVDEAHRSVYQKYKAIFDYFDALVVGLTATPKKDIAHNTYELFAIEDDNPTFAYELTQAVADKYLVPPKGASVPLKFMREGIKYHELSESEQVQYEEKFGDPTDVLIDEIGSEALNRWLFNTDTVDKVLDHLMTDGIKVEGGDKIGKTIIFAKNHNHAVFIEERFNKNYPEYSGKLLRVIDNYEPKAQDLLDRFTNDFKEEDPQIAVSVDMMDTGVDAPRVVNLVFFKLVKSASKFWQMIGRGTRLRPNLFAPGEHKSEFLIFDFCQNFEFFDEYPDGIEASSLKPISQLIFEARLEVAQLIGEDANRTKEDAILAEQYIDGLHVSIATLDQDRFVVRKELRKVNEYTKRERWNNLTKGDVLDISMHLAVLPVPEGNDELARRFDYLTLVLQLCKLKGKDDTRHINRVVEISKELSRMANVPVVAQQMPLILKLQDAKYWNGRSLTRLEELRIALRDLVKFIEYEKQDNVYTNFKDELDVDSITHRDVITQYQTLRGYRDRVERYLRENKDHMVIHKITHNEAITESELKQLETILFDEESLGTKEEYEKEYGNQPLGTFIRSILGMDIEAANTAFAEFINLPSLRADQMTFINKIINYLTKNGIIEKRMLFEPPFTEQHQDGIIGLFDDAFATKIISIVDKVNRNAEVG